MKTSTNEFKTSTSTNIKYRGVILKNNVNSDNKQDKYSVIRTLEYLNSNLIRLSYRGAPDLILSFDGEIRDKLICFTKTELENALQYIKTYLFSHDSLNKEIKNKIEKEINKILINEQYSF